METPTFAIAKIGTNAKSSDEYKHSQKDLNQNRMTAHC